MIDGRSTYKTMSTDDRISAKITDGVKIQVLTKIQEIKDLLPFLINLTREEKQRIPTIGTELGGMDEAFTSEMSAQPELAPSYVDRAEMASDRELRGEVLKILQRSREMCDAR